MKVRHARSLNENPRAAVAEGTACWEAQPQMIFAFCSPKIDPEGVAAALTERFPGTPLAGCSTAGEHLGSEHSTGSLALVAIYDSSLSWATQLISDVSTLNESRATKSVDELFLKLETERDLIEPDRHFALLLIDGLSMIEERVVAILADALEGIPLAGGSAGDDLNFERTTVFNESGALQGAAVIVLGEKGRAQVEIMKHQHFEITPKALCITRATPESRTVQEIDGYPAIEAYAAALGIAPQDVTNEVAFLNPVTFSCNGQLYVRSIQQLHPDGSMTFYCAIEEGMVLEVGSHGDMSQELRRDLGALGETLGKADLVIGFNCILRALEAEKTQMTGSLASILQTHTEAMIGFDTYGEQLNGLHINQTLVAVAIRDDVEAR